MRRSISVSVAKSLRRSSPPTPAALDKEAAGLLQQSSALGVLRNSDALNLKEDSERRESYIKYTGYLLSILAIIMAGIAQLTRKGG